MVPRFAISTWLGHSPPVAQYTIYFQLPQVLLSLDIGIRSSLTHVVMAYVLPLGAGTSSFLTSRFTVEPSEKEAMVSAVLLMITPDGTSKVYRSSSRSAIPITLCFFFTWNKMSDEQADNGVLG